MSSTQVRGADFKLEIVLIPVSDFDRAKRFYSSLNGIWQLTHVGKYQARVVQRTFSASRARRTTKPCRG